MFIRFVVGADMEKLNSLNGPFTELYLLKDNDNLYDYELELANQIFDWFNDELPCPPFSQSKWPRTAICWFKDNTDAQIYIHKMYEIQAILHEHGKHTRAIKTQDPGMTLYEDNFQVVATSPRGKY